MSRPSRGLAQEKLPLYLGFLRWFTVPESEEKHCCMRSLSYWSPQILEVNMSLKHMICGEKKEGMWNAQLSQFRSKMS